IPHVPTELHRRRYNSSAGATGERMVPRVATWCVLALLGLSGHALAQTNPAKESGIGVLSPATSSSMETRLEAFRQELAAHGYQDGKNLRIEYRWGDGKDERLSALAGELA